MRVFAFFQEETSLSVKFASEIVKLNATLDIFESGRSRNRKYFCRGRDYWEEKAVILKNEGISMAVSFRDDDDFDSRLAERGLRIYLKIRSIENQTNELDLATAITQSRGHNRYAGHS